MAKSQQSYNKKEKEKKRLKKRQDKLSKMEERRANSDGGSSLDDMIAYVDENGMITDTPPDPSKKTKVKASSIEIGVPKKEEKEVDSVHTGTVSYFDETKGFGFIIDSQNQEKYFVHVSGLLEEVYEGNKVQFELERGLKGMNATKVKKVS
ncbi:MAG: cold shock domain-containing protein [Bacteroidales bacterium]|nr:cold shock domain-containing protein [Bacteroidales bacterium]